MVTQSLGLDSPGCIQENELCRWVLGAQVVAGRVSASVPPSNSGPHLGLGRGRGVWQGTFGNAWRHLWLSQQRGRSFWPAVGRN